MSTYVALLRGINLGKRQVKMSQLKLLLESLGFCNVRTLLASGNVVFESDEKNVARLTQKLERELAQEFGFPIDCIIRSMSQVKGIVNNNPFKSVSMDAATRLYVTFFSEQQADIMAKSLQLSDEHMIVIPISKEEIGFTLQLTNGRGTVDAMTRLEKQFGKKITTRNWNTIQKLVKL